MLGEKNLAILARLKEKLLQESSLISDDSIPIVPNDTVCPDWVKVTQDFSDNVDRWKEKQINTDKAFPRVSLSSKRKGKNASKQQVWELAYVAPTSKSDALNRDIDTNDIKNNKPKKTKKEKRLEKIENKQKIKNAAKRMATLPVCQHIVNTGGTQYYMHNDTRSKSIYTYSGGDVRPK